MKILTTHFFISNSVAKASSLKIGLFASNSLAIPQPESDRNKQPSLTSGIGYGNLVVFWMWAIFGTTILHFVKGPCKKYVTPKMAIF